MAKEPSEKEIGTGEESPAELAISNHVGTVIHLFLSALAVLLLIAAAIATFETIVRDFPKLWGRTAGRIWGFAQDNREPSAYRYYCGVWAPVTVSAAECGS